MDKEEGNGPEAVRTTQTCISHEAGSSDKVRGSTLDTQEDAYGPWVVVACRKQGSKISRGSGGESNKTYDSKLQDHEDVGNETRLEVDVGKTIPFIDSLRESKRKLLPLRAPTSSF